MTPPPLLLLQLCNALIAFGSVMTMMVGVSHWSQLGWAPWRIGIVTTIVNLCYGAVVAQGGWFADHWGRARIGMVGCCIGFGGCVAVLLFDCPATTIAAAMMGFGGSALFFPGCAGLFSDAQGRNLGPVLPLHRKLSRYNLGWAAGNLGGFVLLDVAANHPRFSYCLAGGSFLVVGLALARWRALPPLPGESSGDRAPHPWLPRLTLMSRINLFFACTLGMAMITQLEKAFTLQATKEQAVHLTRLTLSCYSLSYIMAFIVLGAWNGWIYRPWRLWFCQLGLVIGSGGILLAGVWQSMPWPVLACCGILVGSGYGSAYTSSIYYSLRLPHGASRAAGLHETFLGLGNTLGPLLAGWFLSTLVTGVAGMGMFMALAGLCCLILQVMLIPRGTAMAGVAAPRV